MVTFRRNALTKTNVVEWLRNFIYEAVSPRPLAGFRIAFATIILIEFLYFAYRRDFVFLEFPLRDTISDDIVTSLWIWVFAIIAMLIGFLTPLAAAINYLYITTFFAPHSLFSYHADMLYVPSSLLMIVLPASRCWSVDRRLMRYLWSFDTARFPLPRFYQNVLILWVMGFMYFDSTLYKFQSPFWRNGLGFWLPASFASFTTFSWNAALNQKLLMETAGYVTLLYEAAFIFLFWIPPARIYLLVIGLILHLGIAIVFPIPLFGLLMAVLFINFLPLDLRVLTKVDQKPGFLHFDVVLVRVLMTMTTVAVVTQACITFDLPVFQAGMRDWLEQKAGIATHRVFGHWQFNVMKQDVALVFYDTKGNERWIPWIKQDGHVGSEGYGRFWSFWWLNSLPQQPGQRELWARAAEAWAKRNQVRLETGKVIVKTKAVTTDPSWEANRHQKNALAPWIDYMKLTWTNQSRHFEYIDFVHGRE